MTPLAGLLDRLPQPTLAALDLGDVVPPEGVVLLLVVTEPAPVQRVAARGLKYLAVMSASPLRISQSQGRYLSSSLY